MFSQDKIYIPTAQLKDQVEKEREDLNAHRPFMQLEAVLNE